MLVSSLWRLQNQSKKQNSWNPSNNRDQLLLCQGRFTCVARDTPTQLRWPPHHHGPANQLSFSSKWLDDHHHGHRHQRHRCGIKQPWLLQGSISRDATVDVRGLALRVVDNQENMERKNCASCMAIHIGGGKKGKNPKASSKIIKAWNHSGLPDVPSPLHQSKLIQSPPKSTSEGCLVRLHCNRRVDQGHHFFDRYTS